MNDWRTAYLGLGSSLGARRSLLQDAVQRLADLKPRLEVTGVSPIYEAPHLGLKPEDETRYPAHLNCVVKISTNFTPSELLDWIQAIEEKAGRQRLEKWAPRTLDIDILLYNGLKVQTEELTIPHPGLAERAFVVLPLYDLTPELILPDGSMLAELRRSEVIRKQRITRFEEAEPLL